MMGRRLIEVAEVLVDHVHKAGYQHRVLEDSIHAETQKRVAAERDRDHWRAARQDAITAGELMQAEIERLRQQLSADAVRQELEEFKAKNAELQEKLATVENAAATENERLRQQLAAAQRAASDEFTERQVLTAEQQQDAAAWQQQVDGAQAEVKYLRDRLDEGRSISADLQQQLDVSRKETTEVRRRNFELVKERDAALTAVSLQRAGIERLNAFVGKVRSVVDNDCDGLEIDEMIEALEELNAGNSEATLNSSVVKDCLTTEPEGVK